MNAIYLNNGAYIYRLFNIMDNIFLLPHLLVFAEVARRGSFTHAAAQLKMSKSAVSQKVRRLEEQIGAQLLTRNTRGMALTATGRKLFERSELLGAQVDVAFRELASAEQSPAGPFSVTFPTSMEAITAKALRQLCLEFPRLEPRVLVRDEPLDLIGNGLDVALRFGILKDSDYRALPLGTVAEVFCASPRYLQQFGTPRTPDDLRQHRWITSNWQKSVLQIYPQDTSQNPTAIKIQRFADCNSLRMVIEMVCQNMGLALLPEMVAKPLIENGKLCQFLSKHRGPEWQINFIHPFQGEKPLHVARFYELVKLFLAKSRPESVFS